MPPPVDMIIKMNRRNEKGNIETQNQNQLKEKETNKINNNNIQEKERNAKKEEMNSQNEKNKEEKKENEINEKIKDNTNEIKENQEDKKKQTPVSFAVKMDQDKIVDLLVENGAIKPEKKIQEKKLFNILK